MSSSLQPSSVWKLNAYPVGDEDMNTFTQFVMHEMVKNNLHEGATCIATRETDNNGLTPIRLPGDILNAAGVILVFAGEAAIADDMLYLVGAAIHADLIVRYLGPVANADRGFAVWDRRRGLEGLALTGDALVDLPSQTVQHLLPESLRSPKLFIH